MTGGTSPAANKRSAQRAALAEFQTGGAKGINIVFIDATAANCSSRPPLATAASAAIVNLS